jgi:hypothetical protein
MPTTPPLPDLDRLATDAVAAGHFSDIAEVFRRHADELRAFADSLQAVEAEADQVGCVPLEQVDAGMRAAAREAAKRRI